jgi:hypothetical protein
MPRFVMTIPYSLTMSFTNADLERIHASASNVVVSKPLIDGAANVAWIVYAPFPKNFLSWDEQYGIYASNAEIANGTPLIQNALTDPAQVGLSYTMSATAAITGPATGGTPGAFSILNGYTNPDKGYLTFGLTQGATVNSETRPPSALSAAMIMLNSTAVMIPDSAVYLWLQPNLSSNTVVTTVTSPTTKILLSATSPSANLKYDSHSGTFITDGQHAVEVIPAKL